MRMRSRSKFGSKTGAVAKLKKVQLSPRLKSVYRNAREGKISTPQPQSGSNEKVNWDHNLSLNI